MDQAVVRPNGDVYVLEGPTNRVHALTAEGKAKFVADPPPTLLANALLTLHVTREGAVYVAGFADEKCYWHVAPEQDWNGTSGHHWIEGCLFDRRDLIVRRLRRWTNGDWVWGLTHIGTGPKGEPLALNAFSSREEARFGFFQPDATPVTDWTIAWKGTIAGSAAFDGKVGYLQGEEIVAVDLKGSPLWSFKPPAEVGLGRVFLSRNALAMANVSKRTVYWFKLPSTAKT